MLAQALLVQQAIKDTTKPFATVRVELYSHDFLEHMDSGRVVRTQIYSVSLLCRLAKTSAFPKVEISTQMLVDAYKKRASRDQHGVRRDYSGVAVSRTVHRD